MSRTCQCLSRKGSTGTGSFCGYTDGPYAYTCSMGACSEDCAATRGTLVEQTFKESEKDPVGRLELTRRRVRGAIFGDSMPLAPKILMVILVCVVILSIANMLKGKGRR